MAHSEYHSTCSLCWGVRGNMLIFSTYIQLFISEENDFDVFFMASLFATASRSRRASEFFACVEACTCTFGGPFAAFKK